MAIAWIATNIDPQLIKTFRTVRWEVRSFTPVEFVPSDPLNRNDLDLVVIATINRSTLDLCLEICRQQFAPVLALVVDLAYAQAALEGGADDFLLAPANPIEALLRVRKLTRSADIIRVGELEIDLLAWNVYFRGQRVHLSTIEFRLLAALAKRVGQMVDHATLSEEVWKVVTKQKSLAQVTSYIGRVRKKIEPDFQNPQYIISVPGTGYRLRNQRQWEANQRESTASSILLSASS
jgi:DNA-binding response OmpR family regulator